MSEAMIEPIVKTFIGKHIDLTKIISISNAKFIDRMGLGGWYVGFGIEAQLLDKPIIYERELDRDEYYYDEKHILIYGEDGETPLAVERLQKQIDELVEQWREVRKSIN